MSVAIVTGGSRGIGAEIVRQLGADGWEVCFSYRRDADAAAAVESSSPGARAVAADVAVEDDVVRLFAAADEMGTVGALVNNAGIVAPASRIDGLTRHRIERMFAVNAIGPFPCAREAVRRMSTVHGGAGGVIVNISSVGARFGSPNEYADYAASKAAVDAMTLGLAAEVAREGIRAVCVRPGIIDTDIHASGGQPDRATRLADRIPLGRAGRVDEIAGLVRWLCSSEASYVTGTIWDVSGGR